MEIGQITVVPGQATLFDLIDLVKSVDRINNIYFTQQIAKALEKINSPVMVFNPTDSKDGTGK